MPLLLLFLILGQTAASAYWEFPSNNANANSNNWDQQRAARAQKLITLGRYLEKDGDRDMLPPERGQRQTGTTRVDVHQQQQHQKAVPSIWGFSPNFGTTVRAERGEWSPPQNGPAEQQQQQQQKQWAFYDDPYQQQQQQQQSQSSFSQPSTASLSSSSLYSPPSPPLPIMPDQIARPLPPAKVPIVIPPSLIDGTRAIDRFDTNLDRFATGPPAGASPSRIVLPQNFLEKLANRIPTESVGNRKTGERERGGFAEFGQEKAKAAGNPPEPPKTRILTNDRIAPSTPSGTRPSPIVPVKTTIQQQGNGQQQQQPSIDLPVPALPDFRHEDIRPEVDGERLGPQWKFAGPSNQYREDWGKEFTKSEDRRPSSPIADFGSKGMGMGGSDGPVNKFIGSGINPVPPENAQVFIGQPRPSTTNDAQTHGGGNGNNGGGGGRISPYGNGPEEVTGSRWRNLDEYYNALNGGNRGRGPNRYVKVDLLNE